jgi:sporulation protein YlmC with PRC-barrel domain
MTTTPLASLKSSRIDLINTNEDILGRKVVDVNGQDVGKVDDLFADLNERRVRFLSVKSGDILGVGGKTFLIPVDVIQSAGADQVVINESKDRILNGPQVDEASLVATTGTTGETTGSFDATAVPLVEVYEYYAIDEPFWSPTYRSPNWA